MTINKLLKRITYILTLSLIVSCSSTKKDDPLGEKSYEPNVQKRTEEFRNKEGSIIFGIGTGKSSNAGVFDFATSNLLWRATLKSLDFIPLTNADYSGGVIITDWYSDKNSKEQIKIQIRFLSNEVRSDSLQVKSFKRSCETNGQCTSITIGDNFSNEIRDSILNTARIMKIEEQKTKR